MCEQFYWAWTCKAAENVCEIDFTVSGQVRKISQSVKTYC